jgi:hypothetical protein
LAAVFGEISGKITADVGGSDFRRGTLFFFYSMVIICARGSAEAPPDAHPL